MNHGNSVGLEWEFDLDGFATMVKACLRELRISKKDEV